MSLNNSSELQKEIIKLDAGAQKENKDDIHLRELVEGSKMFETEFELNHRKSVLKKVEEIAAPLGGQLLMSSYIRLNAYSPSTDIDAYYVAPKNKTLEDLLQLLTEELEGKPEIKNELAPFITFIELGFKNITVRLVFVNLNLEKVPEGYLTEDMLSSLDYKTQLLIYDALKTYKKVATKLDAFCLALQCVKLFALQRGVYSPIIYNCDLTASVLSTYKVLYEYEEDFTAFEIVHDFYRSYARMKWLTPAHDKIFKLMRKPNQDVDPRSIHGFNYQPATALYMVDLRAPKIRWRSVLHEYKQAWRLTTRIKEGNATWAELFAKPNFFHDYEHFLMVLVSSPPEQHSNLCDRLQTAVCVLSDCLDHNRFVEMVHTNPNCFQRRKQLTRRRTAFWMCTMWFIAVDMVEIGSCSKNLNKNLEKFLKSVRRTKTINLLEQGGIIEVRLVSQNRLNLYVNDDILARGRERLDCLNECRVEDSKQSHVDTELQDTGTLRETHKFQEQFQTKSAQDIDECLHLSNYPLQVMPKNA